MASNRIDPCLYWVRLGDVLQFSLRKPLHAPCISYLNRWRKSLKPRLTSLHMQRHTSNKLCLLALIEALLEGDYWSLVIFLLSTPKKCHHCGLHCHCDHCENWQGGDIKNDRLPKAELWRADRSPEAEGKKEPVLKIFEPHFWSSLAS